MCRESDKIVYEEGESRPRKYRLCICIWETTLCGERGRVWVSESQDATEAFDDATSNGVTRVATTAFPFGFSQMLAIKRITLNSNLNDWIRPSKGRADRDPKNVKKSVKVVKIHVCSFSFLLTGKLLEIPKIPPIKE